MKLINIGWFLLFTEVILSVDAVLIQFKLRQLPRFFTPLNDNIFLASSYNQWQPNDKLFQFDSQSKSLTVDIKNISEIEFKVTRGSWSLTEVLADGRQRANRRLTLTNIPQTIDLIVEQWLDTAGQTHTASNQVYILDSQFSMWPHLPRTRRIWIYLPRSYSTNLNRSYPVVYAHDGQNLFDSATSFSGEWGIDESLDNLSKEIIFVGIDNGGAQRLNELTPFANANYGGGQADYYLDFIVDKLRPYINENFRTKTDRLNTAILGSSLGGLCSFYAALRHENIFGQIGVFSPSFWFTDDIFQSARAHNFSASPPRFYFLAGEKESSSMVSDMQNMINTLNGNNRIFLDSKQLFSRVVVDGQHAEWFWRREFPTAIQWLFA